MALWDKVAGEWGMRTEPEVATSLDPNDGLVDTGITTSDGQRIYAGATPRNISSRRKRKNNDFK